MVCINMTQIKPFSFPKWCHPFVSFQEKLTQVMKATSWVRFASGDIYCEWGTPFDSSGTSMNKDSETKLFSAV